jgi:hypothetical protein
VPADSTSSALPLLPLPSEAKRITPAESLQLLVEQDKYSYNTMIFICLFIEINNLATHLATRIGLV